MSHYERQVAFTEWITQLFVRAVAQGIITPRALAHRTHP